MKPVFQTRRSHNGNCLQAALASILECEIAALPELPEFGWEVPLAEWLRENHGLTYFEFGVPAGFEHERDFMAKLLGYHLLCGTSPGGISHATVAYQGRIVHDPAGRDPGEALDLKKPRYFGVLCRRFDP